MAFEGLSAKLQQVFKNLRGKGRLTEADIAAALREVKLALLEADVNFKVVKDFTGSVREKATGENVLEGLNPAQTVIKIVHDELVAMMGSETATLHLQDPSTLSVLMLVGLQGAGKTTTAVKLGAKLKAQGRKVLLAACDVYRPAAIEQLKVNAKKADIEVFSLGTSASPVDIARGAKAHIQEAGGNTLILDTAGRLHIDEAMMQELSAIKAAVSVDATILVADAMTGQDAVNVAAAFAGDIGINGVILTKLDGDSRGGAALSIRATTGVPIYYAGMGEKLSDLEPFHPDRMASRILGMGDVLTLIEKAQAEVSEEKAAQMEEKLKKATFDYNDYLESMHQMKKMGGLSSVLSMLPGMGAKMKGLENAVDEKQLARVEAMILSMTPKERAHPDIINPSRKTRIARGAGVDMAEVNRLVKNHREMQKQMKQWMGSGGKRRGGLMGMNRLPF